MTDKPMSMVEIVARAIDPGIWNGVGYRLERLGARNEKELAEDRAEVLGRPHVVQSLDRARAAISAMREVSKEMFLAGDIAKENAIDHGYDSDADGNRHDYTTLSSDIVSKIYTAMIDAALSEHQQPQTRKG